MQTVQTLIHAYTNVDFLPLINLWLLSSGAVQVNSNQNMYLPRKKTKNNNSWSSSVCGMLAVVGAGGAVF